MRKLSTPAIALLAVVMSVLLLFAGCSSSSDDGGSPEPSPTQGSGVISGKVTDEAGTPLLGAKVTINAVQGKGAAEKGSVNTDENGEFIFEDLATGIKYKVVAVYNGRVTVEVIVSLTEGTPATFEVQLPQGSGVASFDMPKAPVLNEPTGTPSVGYYYYTGKQSKVVEPGYFTGENLMAVNFSWTKNTERALTFEKYLLFRSAKSGVGTNSTPVFENTSDFTVNATDNLPTNEFGRYHYKLYKSFIVPEVNARLLVGSNEVSFWWDKYIYSKKFGKEGELNFPMGMAIHETDAGVQAIYVCDVPGGLRNGKTERIEEPARVQKFDKNGVLLATWTGYTDEEGEKTFEFTMGVAVDNNTGNVYVTDGFFGDSDNRVIVLDSEGNFIRKWESEYAIGIAVGPGYPPTQSTPDTGKADEMETVVYVTGDYNVYKYNTEGTAYDTITGATNDLANIAIDKDGNIYPAGYQYSFYKFSPKGIKLLTYYYDAYNLFGIDVDENGNIFVANNQNDNSNGKTAAKGDAVFPYQPGFVKFNNAGVPLSFILDPGDGDGQFTRPMAVRLDSAGNVYVADQELKRVTIYKPDYEDEE